MALAAQVFCPNSLLAKSVHLVTRMAPQFFTNPIHELHQHKGPIYNARFTEDANYCLTCGHDRTVQLYNPIKGLHLKEYKGAHNYEVYDAFPFPDNSKFFSAGGDRAAFLWDVTTGTTIRRLFGHNGKINCCSIWGNGSLALTGSYDKRVLIFDLKAPNFKPIQTIDDAHDSVTSLQTIDNELLTASSDGCVRVYDVRMGRAIEDKFHIGINWFDISKDCRFLLMMNQDATLRLMERESGTLLNTYTGFKNTNNYRILCQFSPKNDFLITGCEDGRIMMWDILAENGQIAKLLPNISKTVILTVRCHPKSSVLLSGSGDGTLKVWATDKMHHLHE